MKGSALLPALIAGVVPFIVLFLLVVTPGLGLVAWRPPALWSDLIGPPSSNSGATLIVSDSSGAFVQAYQNSSAFKGGVGGVALVLNKYSIQGSLTWTHLIGNASNTSVNGMSLDSDGLYLIEQSSIDKYDFNGGRVWTVQLETGIGAETIVADPTGIFVAGFADHPLTNQSFTGEVLFVRQYDSGGNLVWTREFSNVNLTGASLSVFAGLSGVYIVYWNGYGPYLVRYDLNGVQLWNHRLASLGISAITGDAGGLYLTGIGDYQQGYLGKYDFNGNLDWSVQYPSPDSSGFGRSNAVLDSSGLYLCMSSIAGHEFLMKYDLSGHQIWSLQMSQSPGAGLPGDQRAFRPATSSGIVYVAGSVSDRSGSGTFSYEAIVVGVSSSASLILFGESPPWSFLLLGGIVTTVAVWLFFLRKRSRTRPPLVRASERGLPVND